MHFGIRLAVARAESANSSARVCRRRNTRANGRASHGRPSRPRARRHAAGSDCADLRRPGGAGGAAKRTPATPAAYGAASEVRPRPSKRVPDPSASSLDTSCGGGADPHANAFESARTSRGARSWRVPARP
ncbi:hypothetical protein G6F64_014687 [Rhizopus arrhizus]|uniref:Uncharacterized protein n=1 Tax=Rhizopus oryzae TaxID=64495 RepID=A0A9P7BJD0_RHIOR|nr:hypothetical protein G6F64_014687 [Rhizopus arrhizus]